jgi:hypothetical protein
MWETKRDNCDELPLDAWVKLRCSQAALAQRCLVTCFWWSMARLLRNFLHVIVMQNVLDAADGMFTCEYCKQGN